MRVWKTTLPLVISAMILLVSFAETTYAAPAKNYLLNFTPILYVTVNNPPDTHLIPGGFALNVPITIRYKLLLPYLFKLFPPLLKNFLVYKSLIIPPARIHLSVEDKPDWLQVSIASPDIYIDIKENEFSCINNSITFAANPDAPAGCYSLFIKVESQPVGRVSSQSTEVCISFAVAYIPSATITIYPPYKELSAKESGRFLINITNTANSKSIFEILRYDQPEGWNIAFHPSAVTLDVGESGTIYVDVEPPENFGNDSYTLQTIEIEIIVMPFPPPITYEENPANTYHVSLIVRNR